MSAKRTPLLPDDPRHGTANGYTNLRCRCDACKEAWRVEMAAQRRRRIGAPFEAKPHGTKSGYESWGCRCDDCTAAKGYGQGRARRSERNARLQELAEAGKSGPQIAHEMELDVQAVYAIASRYGIRIDSRPKPPTTSPEWEALVDHASLPTPERDDLIRSVTAQGFPSREIAQRVSLSLQRVYQIAPSVTPGGAVVSSVRAWASNGLPEGLLEAATKAEIGLRTGESGYWVEGETLDRMIARTVLEAAIEWMRENVS